MSYLSAYLRGASSEHCATMSTMDPRMVWKEKIRVCSNGNRNDGRNGVRTNALCALAMRRRRFEATCWSVMKDEIKQNNISWPEFDVDDGALCCLFGLGGASGPCDTPSSLSWAASMSKSYHPHTHTHNPVSHCSETPPTIV